MPDRFAYWNKQKHNVEKEEENDDHEEEDEMPYEMPFTPYMNDDASRLTVRIFFFDMRFQSQESVSFYFIFG